MVVEAVLSHVRFHLGHFVSHQFRKQFWSVLIYTLGIFLFFGATETSF
jgi:hypothetical protein